jgi:CubicO group peptidase (beta-lactamase class C family)
LGRDYAPVKRDEFIKSAIDSRLKFSPGQGFNYSNVGYGLLGAIIEIVTHQSYERYLYDNLLKPAGLTKTGCMIPKWNTDDVAVGYMRIGLPWGTSLNKAWDTDGPYWNMRASQGVLSTVGDLYKWHIALNGDRILSKKAKEKLFTPHIIDRHYGYGWVVSKTRRGTRLIWHDGSNKIFNAHFRRYVDEGVVVIIATNDERHTADREIMKIEELVFGKN